jgi:putative MATE family efflux protein
MAAPTTAVMLIAGASNVLHTYFVSWLGSEAIAAVALVFPISLITMTLMAGGVGAGIASAIARALGGARTGEAREIAEHAFLLTWVLTVVFTVSIEIALATLFSIMGGKGEVLRQAILFGRILFGGLVCTFVVATLDSIMRGEGNMRIPALCATGSLALQMVLTPLLMFGLGLGLVGAPLATLTGQFIGAIPRVIYVFGGRGAVRPRLLPRRFSRRYIFEILRVGIPASLSVVINYSGLIILTGVFGHLGTAELAAYGLGTRLDFLLFSLGYGVAIAALTLVGMAIGAGRVELVRRYVNRSAVLVCAVVLIPTVVFVWRPDAWIGIFTQDAEIHAVGARYLRIIGPSYLFMVTSMVLGSSFQGVGRALLPLMTIGIRVTLVVGFSLLLTRTLGMGDWAAFLVIALGNALSALILWALWRRVRYAPR